MLKPCPLCGCQAPREKAVSFARGARDGAVVWCPACGCRVARAGVGATQAERYESALRLCSDAWNTRGGVGPVAAQDRPEVGPPVSPEELRRMLGRGA